MGYVVHHDLSGDIDYDNLDAERENMDIGGLEDVLKGVSSRLRCSLTLMKLQGEHITLIAPFGRSTTQTCLPMRDRGFNV